MIIRTYSELITIPTFEERYEYLRLNGTVGAETFGFDRWLNQIFYRSREWKQVCKFVVDRDNGCDLAMIGHEIYGRIIVHHMNPISVDDIRLSTDFLLNPDYLVSTMLQTHNAIHYSDAKLLVTAPIERSKNDTCPWRK